MIARLVGTVAVAVSLAAPQALADDDESWQFRLTPYVWVPSLSMDTTIGASPPTSSDTSILDVLDFAFLIAGEARKGDWGLLAEFNYLALSNDFTIAGGRGGGETKLDGIMGGLAVAYRLAGDGSANVDAFGGFRVWSLDVTADFQRLPSASRSTTFVDPIIGLRGSYDLTPSIFLSGLVEIGGFGAGSDFQWEVVGRVGYRFNDTLALGLGYRHLDLRVDRGQVEIEAAISGPFVALDFNF